MGQRRHKRKQRPGSRSSFTQREQRRASEREREEKGREGKGKADTSESGVSETFCFILFFCFFRRANTGLRQAGRGGSYLHIGVDGITWCLRHSFVRSFFLSFSIKRAGVYSSIDVVPRFKKRCRGDEVISAYACCCASVYASSSPSGARAYFGPIHATGQ